MNPFILTDKTIIITGASSGIGKATAIACAGLGAKIILLGRNETRLAETLSTLNGGGHISIRCDVTDHNDLENLLKHIDKLDGLVHCAGTLQTVPTKFITQDQLQEQFETNYFSAVLLVSNLLKLKKINKGASIVFMSSVAADIAAEPGNAIYSSTKAALQSYARVLALELAPRKIRVNCIAPGMVKTPFLNHFEAEDEQLAENEKKYPLGFGEPEDIAYTAAYLLSDATRWMTGSTIRIDGGLSL